MNAGTSIKVSIDLHRVRQNAQAILAQTGVPVIAVVKADAYGLGAAEVAKAIGDLVDAFYVFDSSEALAANLWDLAHRRTIALNSGWDDSGELLRHHIQPVVWSVNRARELRPAKPVLSIDTGQQRFSCPAGEAAAVRDAGDCREIMTHAVTLPQVDRFGEIVSPWKRDELFLHAAGSALLGEQRARFNAVRPGLALYRGAVRVTAPLVEVRDSAGPAGYTGFVVPRFGVILAGYSHGLRRGPCKVNGQIRRVIEVGMQSAFVELGPGEHRGDEVVLLGDEAEIDQACVARAWGTSQQEVLVRMTKLGTREYV
jgi:alanine racemase